LQLLPRSILFPQRGTSLSMQKKSLLYGLVFLLIGGLYVATHAHLVWSTSVDIAHHYSLVFRLGEQWGVPAYDPTLEEMNVYPRGSHFAAALMGKLVGSPFLGMHLVALMALVLVWASCLAILYAAPKRTGPFNAIVLALAVVLNFGAFRIHGAEISQNYFFAQLVAQALSMAVIAMAIRIEARYARAASYAVFLGGAWLLAFVHLLPAVELLAVLAGLLVLDAAFDRVPQKRVQRRLVGCLVLGIGVMSVVMHPAFSAMRGIANNNGDISLGPLKPLWSVATVCVIALVCSLSLLRAWRRDPVAYIMYKYLGVYGAAVSGLCLLQTTLYYFNIGSDYAARKYAFGVVTFLFMRLALWSGAKLAARMTDQPRFATIGSHPAFAVCMFALTLYATVAGAAKIRQSIDTRAVVALERQLVLLPATAFPLLVSGRQNVVVDLQGMPNVVNYMFSLGIARTPRNTALLILRNGQLGDGHLPVEQFGTIVTSPGNTRFADAARCTTVQDSLLVTIDAVCLGRSAIATLLKQAPAPR
jgi:hypothetical protein